MALLVLDTSRVSIGKAPGNGFTISLSEIEGFPPGLSIIVPFEGEHATEVYDAISESLGKGKPQVVAATASDIRRVAHGST